MENRTTSTLSPSDRDARLLALQELREIGMIDRHELAAETTLLLQSQPAGDDAPPDRTEPRVRPFRLALRRLYRPGVAAPASRV